MDPTTIMAIEMMSAQIPNTQKKMISPFDINLSFPALKEHFIDKYIADFSRIQYLLYKLVKGSISQEY